MENTNAREAMRELTMILLYLSRFKDIDFPDKDYYRAWKGYDFSVLDDLDDKDYIRQGSHPSRSKSVFLTESGKEQAKKLMEKYGIADWE